MHKRISIVIRISKYMTKKAIYTCLLTVFLHLLTQFYIPVVQSLISIFSPKHSTKQQTSDGTSYLKVLISVEKGDVNFYKVTQN